MATIFTNPKSLSAGDRIAAAMASPGGLAAQSSPSLPDSVLAEIPVIVHASHRAAAPGQANQAQTVREETSTVIVFSQGAVVQLSSKLSRGDLVVLTNCQTHADILSRVVNVREQPGGQSYVELEFRQRASGFWQPAAAESIPANAFAASPRVAAPASTLPEVVPFSPAPQKELPEQPGFASTPAPVPSPAPPPASPSNVVIASSAAVEVASAAAAPEASAVPMPSDPLPAETWEHERARLRNLQQSEAKSKSFSARTLLTILGAALTVVALFGEGYLLGHRNQSNDANEPVPRIIFPVQPASALTTDPPSFGVARPLPPDPAAPSSPAVAKAEPAENPRDTDAKEAQPSRNAIPVGKLGTPIARRAVNVGPNVAPPTMPPQGAENLLGEISFGSESAARGPAPSVPAESLGARSSTELQPATLISSKAPVYPAWARTQAEQAVVVVDITIDATGRVSDAKVLSGPPVLEQAVLEAVHQWKYRPAQLNGKPLTSHQTIDVRFKTE